MSQASALALVSNPVLAAIYVAHAGPPARPLPGPVARILELFDGRRNLAEIFAAVRIPESKGLAVVRKLSELGLIEPPARVEDRTALSDPDTRPTVRDLPSARASGFSAAEEAFFASEVQPVDEEPAPSFGEKVSLFVSDIVLRIRGAAL